MFYWHFPMQLARTTTGVNRLMQHIPAGAYTVLVTSWQLQAKSNSPPQHNPQDPLFLPPNPTRETPARSTQNLPAKGINTSLFPRLLASLEDLVWQGLFAILGMQNKLQKGSLSVTFFHPPTVTDLGWNCGAGLCPARLPINNN